MDPDFQRYISFLILRDLRYEGSSRIDGLRHVISLTTQIGLEATGYKTDVRDCLYFNMHAWIVTYVDSQQGPVI